jgi:hypothetical protein
MTKEHRGVSGQDLIGVAPDNYVVIIQSAERLGERVSDEVLIVPIVLLDYGLEAW